MNLLIWQALSELFGELDCGLVPKMAQQSSTAASTAHALLSSALLRIEAVSTKLDIACTRVLQESEIKTATLELLPIFDELSDSLRHREFVGLDEALIYLHDARLCDVLLRLLRRLPWAEMRQHRGTMYLALTLLLRLLSSLLCIVRLAQKVSRNHQATAYAEMSRRCVAYAPVSCWQLLTCSRCHSICACPAPQVTSFFVQAGMRRCPFTR